MGLKFLYTDFELSFSLSKIAHFYFSGSLLLLLSQSYYSFSTFLLQKFFSRVFLKGSGYQFIGKQQMGSPALPVKQMQKFQPLANIHNALLHLHPSPTFPSPLPTQTLPHILHPYLATIYGPQQDTTHFNQSC